MASTRPGRSIATRARAGGLRAPSHAPQPALGSAVLASKEVGHPPPEAMQETTATTATTEERIEARSGVDLTTLIVAALAAAIAALVTSRLWHGGTLFSTAMTPVIVALVKEYLDRPWRKVGQVARAPLQTVRQPNAFRTVSVPAGGRGSDRPAGTAEPLEPADEAQWSSPLDEDGAPGTPYRVYRRRPSVRAWWKVGLITGIVAFVVAAAALTVPELVGGTSVTGSGRTTIFHGSSSSSSGEQSGNDATTG